jgi:PAS domain S-box-containing protein
LQKSFKSSLYVTLGVVIVSIVAIVMLINSIYTYNLTKNNLFNELYNNSKLTVEKLQITIAPFIESYAINEYEKIIENEMKHTSIIAIIVDDYNMATITGKKSYITGKIKNENFEILDFESINTKYKKSLDDAVFTEEKIIKSQSGKNLGTITIYSTDHFINKELKNVIKRNIIVSLSIFLLLIVSLFLTIRHFVLKPISNIINVIENKDKHGIPLKEISNDGAKEIVTLIETMNTMINTIKISRLKLEENEHKLKDSEFRWKFALEGNGDGLWDWNLINNDLYLSLTWKKMIGYEDDELDSRLGEWESRIHQDDIQRVFKDIKDYLAGKREFYRNEHRLLSKENGYRWILARGIVVQRDENGKALRMIGTHSDITEQKESEQKLIDQKREFEAIFNFSSDGIGILDLESNFLNCNDAYLRITGFTKEELLSKSCIELTIKEDKQKTITAIDTVLKKGYVRNFEKKCIVKDNKIITVNMGISMMPDKKRILITVKDISNLKLLESQAKLASMGEMIGNIAHQWRQPLSIITTSASAIDVKSEFGDLSKDDIKDFSKNILNQATYLSKTIDDFKNYIKEDRTKLRIDTEELIDKIINIVSPTIVNNNITLIKNTDSKAILFGYENELIQAIINIVNNAKDAVNKNMKDNNIDEKFVFLETKIKNNKFIILIRDNGGGIPDDIISRIFEPYFTTKHQSIGTGIGLSMAHKIVLEHHHGNINVYNEEYKYNDKMYNGAVFKIEIIIDEEVDEDKKS